MTIPKEHYKEMRDEHRRLVKVLKSPSKKDDKVETKIQEKELAEYEKKAFWAGFEKEAALGSFFKRMGGKLKQKTTPKKQLKAERATRKAQEAKSKMGRTPKPKPPMITEAMRQRAKARGMKPAQYQAQIVAKKSTGAKPNLPDVKGPTVSPAFAGARPSGTQAQGARQARNLEKSRARASTPTITKAIKQRAKATGVTPSQYAGRAKPTPLPLPGAKPGFRAAPGFKDRAKSMGQKAAPYARRAAPYAGAAAAGGVGGALVNRRNNQGA